MGDIVTEQDEPQLEARLEAVRVNLVAVRQRLMPDGSQSDGENESNYAIAARNLDLAIAEIDRELVSMQSQS